MNCIMYASMILDFLLFIFNPRLKLPILESLPSLTIMTNFELEKSKEFLWETCCMKLQVIGTPCESFISHFSSTEVIQGLPYDSKADVYGFGILCWELTYAIEWDAMENESLAGYELTFSEVEMPLTFFRIGVRWKN
jgi:hypothetical protein